MSKDVYFYYVHWNGYGLDRTWEWRISKGYFIVIPGIDFTFGAKRDQYNKGWEIINLETGYQVGSGTTLKNAIELTTTDLLRHGNLALRKAVDSARDKGFVPPPVPRSEDCASL